MGPEILENRKCPWDISFERPLTEHHMKERNLFPEAVSTAKLLAIPAHAVPNKDHHAHLKQKARTLARSVNQRARHTVLHEELLRAGGAEQLVAHRHQEVRRLEEGDLRLHRAGAQQDLLRLVGQTEARRDERLEERLVLVGAEARDLQEARKQSARNNAREDGANFDLQGSA